MTESQQNDTEADKTIISMIVAASKNNAIGKNNELLWHLPADMKFFKNTTWAMPVVMGRKTYEALGKPLSGRFNVVISNNRGFNPEGVTVVNTLDAAIEAAGIMETKEIFIIGGGQIYQQAMPIADRIYMTRVNAELEGDAYFPEIDPAQWQQLSSHLFEKDEKHAYDFTFEIWQRK